MLKSVLKVFNLILQAVHKLREEQMAKQHQTEVINQKAYMDRSKRELKQRHAIEVKQQPKSLKVG